jgi:phosphoribosyl 1,2-cyclic phosphodiesterase
MFNDFNALGHAVAFITYGLLAILIASRYMRRYSDRALFCAALFSALWAAALVTQSLWGFPDLFKHPGILDIRSLTAFEALELGNFSLTPLPLNHSKLTFGYAIAHRNGARFAYLTDTFGLPQDSDHFLKQWGANDIAVDCSHPPAAPSGKPLRNHNDVPAALDIIQRSGACRGWLTHLSHETDC